MVRGLEVFREYFAAHADQFVLIGGTASTLVMQEAGLEFRATKDFDIVLIVEALTPEFGTTFWAFVEAGAYEQKEAGDAGKARFYRFQKPSDVRFPAMLELFSRAPDGIAITEGSRLTPIPLDEAVASLSAILLDEAYYDFVRTGRTVIGELPTVGPDQLIPLKASAWLDLRRRKARGETIDSKNIRKHANDVLKLSRLLTPDQRVPIPNRIAADMRDFLQDVVQDITLDPKSLGIDASVTAIAEQLSQAYGLQGAGTDTP